MPIVEAFTITELGIFIGTIFASIGGLLLSIQKSRCTNIKCCGCICEREVFPAEDEVGLEMGIPKQD